ncbi:hypothetical protein HPB52_015419 [Rhipicephalus sanguineus]|uniref:Uncharacterized protein n=1 Tax=Rhipicephalus sanguineus TaxID=34632 RepID=A0A9D4PP19_RHISA|nr:hypothetical protein HPB52_015419 [Rhipicephalus sanguineus]
MRRWSVTAALCRSNGRCLFFGLDGLLQVPSLTVPLNKSMKNLSCPDLTKIALQNGGGTSDEDIQRAPSLGDSIGDTMSLHSDQGTEDELQFAFKNQKLLRTDRYGEDSDSSDCSHLEMMPETPALRPHSAEKRTASDWMTAQLTNLKLWFAELQEDFSEWHPVEAILHGLWNDCLLTLIFVGIALGLVKNYLSMKGFLGATTEDVFTTDHKKLGIGMGIDKVPAIMSLNMKIAKTFHVLSDAFDKGLSLWTWRNPAVTVKVLGILGVLALYSMIRPTAEVIKVLGTGLVLKAFVLDYVFVRFPRVRAKYDFAWILWNELPTGPEIEKQARQNKKKEKLSKKKSDVYTFGTVANRDETFKSIVEQGMQNNCKWASIADLLQTKTS